MHLATVDVDEGAPAGAADPVPAAARLTALGSLVSAGRSRLSVTPTAEEKAAVDELIPDGDELWPYVAKFVTLTILSAGIASFGLLSNSSAVVIGAMLVAPLMTPITATAGATVTAHNGRLVRALLIIVMGTALAVAVGYVTTLVAGTAVLSDADLPEEVVARTFPGLLDLGIAITAGAAAGYIAPRRSVTSALPGVGIAVALVPPLATVGITAALGLGSDAQNAMLLYLTNLAAIVFAASFMLLLAGFRPDDHPARGLRRRLALTVIAVIAVAIPLTLHTRETLRDSALRASTTQAVEAWDDQVQIRDLQSNVDDDLAVVELRVAGSGEPKPAWQLAEEIRDRFGGPVDLRLFFDTDEQFVVSAR
ncbi:DUF389 domain-containing protein [soil metagenome]